MTALASSDVDALPRLLTYDEAADYLRRSTRTIQRMVRVGTLRVVTPGGGRPLVCRESIRIVVEGDIRRH